MNKEELSLEIPINDDNIELLNLLEKEYGVRHYMIELEDGNKLDVVDYDRYLKLEQENKQLKDNWNKLKEYIENKIDEYDINLEFISAERMCYIHNKMQELESSDSNE